MTVRSGLKCLESSMRQGPLGSLERMLAASSVWNSTKCLLTWNWKATPRGRSILELSASTPRTAGCESGLLPTAMGMNREPTPEQTLERQRIYGGKTRAMYMQDRLNLIMLKTPSSVETEGGVMEIRPGCDGHYKLRDQIAMLPSPRAGNPGSRPNQKGGKILAEEAAKAGMLPTPKARDWKGGQGTDTVRMEHDLDKKIGTSRGLKLQPAFVEWMMGYPLGFTHVESKGSKPSATRFVGPSPTKSSRESQG